MQKRERPAGALRSMRPSSPGGQAGRDPAKWGRAVWCWIAGDIYIRNAMRTFIEETLREAKGPVFFGLEENAARLFPYIEVYPRPEG